MPSFDTVHMYLLTETLQDKAGLYTQLSIRNYVVYTRTHYSSNVSPNCVYRCVLSMSGTASMQLQWHSCQCLQRSSWTTLVHHVHLLQHNKLMVNLQPAQQSFQRSNSSVLYVA